MDFLNDKTVSPYVAYIFEFEHTLDKEDLSYIWQNLMPKIARDPEKQSVTVSHDMTTNEFFEGKSIPEDTQWMVFKVKRKANFSYYAATSDSSDDDRFAFQFQAGGEAKVPNYSYNWPYDFFSLVELTKLDAELEFTAATTTRGDTQTPRQPLERPPGGATPAPPTTPPTVPPMGGGGTGQTSGY